MSMPKNPAPLDELELYELMVAAYPERYQEHPENEDEQWEEVFDHVQEIGEVDSLSSLLGRLVYLAGVQESPITGTPYHVLGAIEKSPSGVARTMVAVKRKYEG